MNMQSQHRVVARKLPGALSRCEYVTRRLENLMPYNRKADVVRVAPFSMTKIVKFEEVHSLAAVRLTKHDPDSEEGFI